MTRSPRGKAPGPWRLETPLSPVLPRGVSGVPARVQPGELGEARSAHGGLQCPRLREGRNRVLGDLGLWRQENPGPLRTGRPRRRRKPSAFQTEEARSLRGPHSPERGSRAPPWARRAWQTAAGRPPLDCVAETRGHECPVTCHPGAGHVCRSPGTHAPRPPLESGAALVWGPPGVLLLTHIPATSPPRSFEPRSGFTLGALQTSAPLSRRGVGAPGLPRWPFPTSAPLQEVRQAPEVSAPGTGAGSDTPSSWWPPGVHGTEGRRPGPGSC